MPPPLPAAELPLKVLLVIVHRGCRRYSSLVVDAAAVGGRVAAEGAVGDRQRRAAAE